MNQNFYSVSDIQRAYEYTSQGHWFEKSTMRFFGTRLTSNFRKIDDNTYLFITTEKPPMGERHATVRVCTIKENKNKHCGFDMAISTLGDFCQMSLARAKTAMKNYQGD